MPSYDRSRSRSIRHSTNPPSPARQQADLSPVQALGNQLMQSIQPKLEVNAPNDSYEQEADRFAGQVTSAPAQRESKEPEKKKDDKAAQKKPLAAQATPLIQRAAQEPDKKKDDKAAQKADKAPDDKKKDDKAVPKADKGMDDKKKDDKAAQKMPVQRADKAPDDKKKDDKAAQKADKAPDDKKKDDKAAQKMPIQRQSEESGSEEKEEEEAVQTKRANPAQLDDEKKKKDDKAAQKMPLQREAAPGTTTADPGVEQDVERQKQGGRPLSSAERQYFEPRFGADFSSVRVHDDAEAARAADDLNAKAFTQGSHIFFGSGYHQPNDTPGRQLMAHELTHTLQQGGAQPAAPTSAPVQATPRSPAMVQRVDEPPPDAANTEDTTDATQFNETKGKIDSNENPTTLTFDKIRIPSFKNNPAASPKSNRRAKYTAQNPLRRTKSYSRANNQRDVWRRDLPIGDIKNILQSKVQPPTPQPSRYIFEIAIGGGESNKFYYFGTLDEVAHALTLPTWTGTDTPQFKRLQVDHILELQLANWPANTSANTIANMELLSQSANASSGTTIDNNIDAKLRQFITDTNGRYGRSTTVLRANLNIDFQGVDPESGDADLPETEYWSKDEIVAGAHLTHVVPSNEIRVGGTGEVWVFGQAAGGISPKHFRWPGSLRPIERNWLDPFVISQKTFNTDENAVNDPNFGSLVMDLPNSDRVWKPGTTETDRTVNITRAPGSRFAGSIDKQAVLRRLRNLRVKKSSPIEVGSFDIGPDGIEAAGVITSDLPIIRGATIDWRLANGELTLSKTFATTEFTLPPPIHVTNSALTFAIGTRSGLTASGRMDFEITNLGQGYLEAGAGTATSIFLEGHFDFDSNLFQPAAITMRYREGEFSGEGHLGIPGGKLKGIRSARIDVSYATGTFTATGTIQPSIPGVQQGTLGVVYSEQDGLVISGSLQLAENPAIRSGSIEARVQRNPDGSYKVHASGTAQPKVPGINSELSVTYDDGAFDMSVTANFSRGMLSGSLRAAATNRAINPDTNQPEGEPTERVTVYGGGEVTVRFAPWLQGTAGIKLLPNGEIEISGSIGLPSAVNLFDARRFDRNIFHISIDIPIVGVSVAGQRIGIFATIGGGLDLRAGVGPGQLQNLNLGVTYNPSHEDQTHVTGHGEFVIPADAGLRLSIHGGIGAGIPIVSAEAGIEVSGELGLQGEARASVDVDWTPQRGIVLDAAGSIFVEPRLKLDLSAYVSVTADLLFTTIDLYSHRWRLAGTEIGSNLRFGVTFPIHYEQNQPFSLSTDDVNFVIPEIDPESILSSIF